MDAISEAIVREEGRRCAGRDPSLQAHVVCVSGCEDLIRGHGGECAARRDAG